MAYLRNISVFVPVSVLTSISVSDFDDTHFLVWQQSQPTSTSSNQPPSQTTMLNVIPIKFHMRWVEKLEIYQGNHPERLTQLLPSIVCPLIKTVSALLSEDKVVLRDNGDRFCLFHDLGIPLIYHGPLLQKIASVAASARGSRMPIVVDLLRLMKRVIKIPMTIHDVVTSSNDEYEVVSVTIVLDFIESYEPKPIPAAESSIRALEKVMFQGGPNSIQECTICMEEFQIGSKVTRMPCSHVYHENCIFKWLKTSHVCPLCRYPMPQDC